MFRKTSFFLLFFALTVAAGAQYQTKTLEATYDLPAGKKVDLNLKFATAIKVGAWDRDQLGVKTILTFSDESLQKIYISKVREDGDALRIETGYDISEERKDNYSCWSCNRENDRDDCICLQVRYELLLPADARLNLETISGDIEIRGLGGVIRARSISGFVDMALSSRNRSDLRFRSVTGEIYSDFDVQLDDNSTAYSKSLTSSLNGGGPEISLETVSGDIFFRKMK